MTWQLRRAVEADLDAVMAIEEATFPTDSWSRASMLAELRNPHAYYLVAAPVSGLATAPPIDAYGGVLCVPDAGTADIQTIAVAEGARRRGLGRTLLLALLAEAARRGARETFLEVRVDNDGAQELYRSLGFERIAVRRRYYRPGVDALVMRRVAPAPVIRPAASSAGAGEGE